MKRICIIFLTILCFPMALLSQTSILGDRSEEEVSSILEEDSKRDERIKRWIEENNRRTQETIDKLEDRVSAAIRRSRPQQGLVSTQKPSGGLVISVDKPQTHSHSPSSQAVRAQQRKQQRDREHREWLEQRREEIAERNQQQAERKEQHREEKARRQQEHYNRVYATEYMREGSRTRKQSEQADWRVGEGADLLDCTHTARSLMNTSIPRDFSKPTRGLTRQHSIRSLAHRRTAVSGLDSYAIPWGTMKADARPYEEWGSRLPVRDIPPATPARKAVPSSPFSNEVWRHMQENIGNERTDMIRAAIYHECNGFIPEIRYEASDGRYHLYDPKTRKMISIDTQEGSIAVHQLTEKDDDFSKLWNTFSKSASVSVALKAPRSLSSTVSFSPGKEEKVSYSGTVGSWGGKISNEGVSVSGGDATMKVNTEEVAVEVEKKTVLLGKEQEGKETEEEISGVLSASVKLLENNSQITHRKYFLTSKASIPAVAIGGSYGMGVTLKLSATASAGLRHSGAVLSSKFKSEATFANAGGESTVMTHFYDKMCFATVSATGKLGYSYSVKKERGAGRDFSLEKERNLGNIPLVLSGGVTLKCYQPQEYALSQPNDHKP